MEDNDSFLKLKFKKLDNPWESVFP
jgi:hypothetical protein